MPFISPRIRSVLLLLSPALLTVAQFLPAPVGPVLGILAFVAGGLAGLAMDAPRWVASAKRYIPASMVASALTLAGMLEAMAESAPTGPVQLAMKACALLLTFLGGAAAPAPQLPGPSISEADVALMTNNVAVELAVNTPAEVLDQVLAESKPAA